MTLDGAVNSQVQLEKGFYQGYCFQLEFSHQFHILSINWAFGDILFFR